jgi:exosortase
VAFFMNFISVTMGGTSGGAVGRPRLETTALPSTRTVLIAVVLIAAVLWSFWTTLASLAERWTTDAHYSHGFLVPVFALVLLAYRRGMLQHVVVSTTSGAAACGLGILSAAVLVRLAAARLYVEPLDAFTLLPTLAGAALVVGGWPALRWCWPAIAFLAFMLPLPFQIETALAQPLRRWATHMSVYLLQTLGYPALADGNIILLEDARLGVADACSGLGMLMTFFALATAMALVIRAPLVDRLVLVVSAVPIAVFVNIVRILATAMAHRSLGPDMAQTIMHDLAGWLMMPLAVALLYLELRLLGVLLVPVPPTQPLAVCPAFSNASSSEFSQTPSNRSATACHADT